MRRRIGIVTTARSEYGIYRPLLRRLGQVPGLDFGLFVGGMHLSPEHGQTVREIEAEGWPILARVPIPVNSETPQAMARSMGEGTVAMGAALATDRPDILVVLGDRFEMHAAALAALPFSIPLAHIHGGELTLGAVDDIFRHSLTKLSHLHFPSTPDYADRIMQMGEEAWRVTMVGAPALDAFLDEAPLADTEVERAFGVRLDPAPILVTLHSETQGEFSAADLATVLTGALSKLAGPIIITAPNADPGGMVIAQELQRFAGTRDDAVYIQNLGARGYRTVLSRARVMIGNSSSGLIEAASFALPVVNMGDRQAARVRARNVIDVPAYRAALDAAIKTAMSVDFRSSLSGMVNPYGDGHAAERIVTVLRDMPLDQRLLVKRFQDIKP